MTTTTPEARPAAGSLQRMAREFGAALAAGEQAEAQEMLAAWSDAYWGTRNDLDALIAYVAEQKAAGQSISPSWLSRERRLKAVLATAKAELDRYAKAGARAATRAQENALRAAQADARRLAAKGLETNLPGLDVDLAPINPANLENAVGFLQDGTPLANHMRNRVGGQASLDALKDVLTQGLTQGWSQDRMVRAYTKAFAIPHTRAVTIMRTESLRAYRETSRATYQANAHVIATWTWQCALDRASCGGCVAMHGTTHPVDETLDGHPRCRCAMIPNTKTWAELGLEGVPETAPPPLEKGVDWFNRQPASYQRGLLGAQKYAALKRGEFDLSDVVARRYDPDWGTMRTERSLRSIRANKDRNWNGLDEPPPPNAPNVPPQPKTPPAPKATTPRPPAPPTPATPSLDLPSDLAPSRFPDSELRRYRDQLRTLDDKTARAQMAHKDKGAADLARREWDDRLRRMDPADMEDVDLARALDPDDLGRGLSAQDRPRLQALLDEQARRLKAREYDPPWKRLAGGPEDARDALRRTNPNYGQGTQWGKNCTNCATTYELRRRGFDVTAQSRSRGRPSTETPAAWGFGTLEYLQAKRTWLQTQKWALTQGEGARGVVTMQWAGGGGHIFNWEVTGGKVRWFEPQNGTEYDLAYLRRAAKPHGYAFRLDDRDVTEALNAYLLNYSTDPTGPH